MKMQISFTYNGVEYRSALLPLRGGVSLEDMVGTIREKMADSAILSLKIEDGSFVIITKDILNNTLLHFRAMPEVSP